jgi:Holliday junction DNA helicase RuvA
MLARLTGTLESLAANTALLTPNGAEGVAYEILLPAYLADRLSHTPGMSGAWGANPEDGSARRITLHTLQYLESQNQGASFIPRLLGFASPHEREFFELLTSVKGLGNKRAMRAMAVEPHAIARAIAERDARFLQTLPEIGPKLAELIVHELKSKVDRFLLSSRDTAALNAAANASPARLAAPSIEPKPTKSKKSAPSTPPPAPPPSPIRATVQALIALGENPLDAERMVARAIDNARAADQPPPATADELLTAAYAAR